MRTDMTARISGAGWDQESFRVIVIDPELEEWIWQRNVNIANAIGFRSQTEMLADPHVKEAWPNDRRKPINPKETLDAVLRKNRIPRTSSLYETLTGRASIRGCADPAFNELREALQQWFPLEVGQ